LGRHQSLFGKPPFQVVPGGESFLFTATHWLGLVGAKKDVPADLAQAQLIRLGAEGGRIVFIHKSYSIESAGGTTIQFGPIWSSCVTIIL
jgi:hypothetical protein